MAKNIGTVIQVIGPVLDIRFPEGSLPELLNAIEVPNGEATIVAEVAQHLGDQCGPGRRHELHRRPSAGGSRHGHRRAHFRPCGRGLPGPDV